MGAYVLGGVPKERAYPAPEQFNPEHDYEILIPFADLGELGPASLYVPNYQYWCVESLPWLFDRIVSRVGGREHMRGCTFRVNPQKAPQAYIVFIAGGLTGPIRALLEALINDLKQEFGLQIANVDWDGVPAPWIYDHHYEGPVGAPTTPSTTRGYLPLLIVAASFAGLIALANYFER